jgi:hypothetical protein
MKAKYIIEPTAVVFDFNYDEADIFTNKADLVMHLLSHDGYKLDFMVDHDGGYEDHFVHLSCTLDGQPKFWMRTRVLVDGDERSEVTQDMKRDAVMEIYGTTDILDPYKLSGSMNITLETVRSLTDIIQDGKACGETESIEAQENLLAKLHGTNSAD